MRAALFTDTDTPVDIVDVDLQSPEANEVRIRITAAGVCHSELHLIRGEWEAPVPLVPGHEGSGIVTEVGPGVAHLHEGDHVVLSWNPYCGECRECVAGRETRCHKVASVINATGTLLDGTSRLSIDGTPIHHYLGVSSWAEEVVVPATGAIRVRDDAPLDAIALVGCAAATGVGAVVNTARVTPGSTVAVIGCGGVGLNIVQGARMQGAERIIAVDLSPDRAELARTFGATDAVGSAVAAEAIRELEPHGVDFAFDAIGHVTTTEAAINSLGLGGAAVIVGLPPAGATASFEPLALAEMDARILGSNYGSIRPQYDIPKLVDLYMTGELLLDELITARRPLDEVAQAVTDLASGAQLRQLLIP
ncbi:alcohol dehydrogenase catalytic domain-containing protein [Gordonia sp. OPL2]|uniref:alcohol dehydrogenase catalytic domain-containing protein n=1 Tax=Gordonia sp. OPL2 TaxID=2486274 RepID=UPI001654FAC3|nr:Zn-dependent alcohol dehydrogenase [Gordonia sp. OPL2]ROZ99348.1 Zn-dependent alcohol dehydrogenase [Gordonia sp. OPL2]